MKLIELTQGRVAIVDNRDFEWLSKWKWCYISGPTNKTGYAIRTTRARKTMRMATEILKRHGLWKRSGEVDHINTCGCDNRKKNLRMGTKHGNQRNQGLQTNNTSGVTGVNWDKTNQKWLVRLVIDKRCVCSGRFIDKKDAIAARRQAEIKYFGEYHHNPFNLCPLWKTGQCPDCTERARELGLIR